jgi:peptidoglycan-associated lipoprotein
MKKLLLPALLATLLAACGGTGDTSRTAADVEDRTGNGVRTVTTGDVSGSGMEALNDPDSILSDRSVYFDFDSFTIRSEFTELVEAHARFLQENRDMRMMIQGNTDERGSREYNLALGQKRAEAVKQALTLLGVSNNRIEAVSLGEEKPRCTERTESCFAENRRSDMLYSGEF